MSTRTRREKRQRAPAELFALTAEELEQVREMERVSANDSGLRHSLYDALRQRESLVRQVEGGYGDGDEFDNDLAVRSILEGMMSDLPRIRERLMAIIEPLDARFLAATRPTPFPRLPWFDAVARIRPRNDMPWWAFRLPRLWSIQPEENGPPIWDEHGRPVVERVNPHTGREGL